MNPQANDKLDQLLNGALARYGDVEPLGRPGSRHPASFRLSGSRDRRKLVRAPLAQPNCAQSPIGDIAGNPPEKRYHCQRSRFSDRLAKS